MMAYCFGSSLSPSHSLRAAATTATLSCALKSGLWNSVQQMGSSFLELYVKFIPDLLCTLLLHLLLTHDFGGFKAGTKDGCQHSNPCTKFRSSKSLLLLLLSVILSF